MEIKLGEEEKIVLDNGYVGYRQKLTLTNKRLVYKKKEGVFKTKWNMTKEIPLEQIEEAYTHTTGGFSQKSYAKLRMKNGKITELNVEPGTGDALGMLGAADMGTELAIRTKTVCDKWVNAINQQLRIKGESQTEMLEQRIRELEKKLKEKQE